MQHSLDENELGEYGLPVIDAVQKCVHCGFCLPTCPTYQVLGQEMDSPRGRILLMKEVLEGNLEHAEAASHVDQCLGCLACETHCPSGVPYGELLNSYRAIKHHATKRTWAQKIRETLVHQTVPYPARFRWAIRMGRLTRPLWFLLPKFLKPMLELIPDEIPAAVPQPISAKADCKQGTVGLLAGCAQQVLAPEINAATISLLTKLGFEVVVPPNQSCCGGLDWHEGRAKSTQNLAAKNFDKFAGLETIITNAAGCGSAIKEYGLAFAGSNRQNQAKSFASRVIDISVFVAEHLRSADNNPSFRLSTSKKIAYHDACHLAHAQSIRRQPRSLLGMIENAELVPIANSDLCCGSAGTYNLSQPEIATTLGRQKAQCIIDSGCDIVVAGNIGCLVQVKKYLRELGSEIAVMHTIELMDQALLPASAPRK